MRIAIDIDNCLNNLTEQTLKLYNSSTGKNIQLSDLTVYNFSECLPQADATGICNLFLNKDLWDSLIPIKDSVWGIKTLVDAGHEVILTTATSYKNFAWKCEWFCKWFPFFDTDNIIRIVDKSLVNCDVMVEDNIDQLTKSICERIVLDYPWNQDESKDFIYDIIRVTSWKEIVRAINNIRKKVEE